MIAVFSLSIGPSPHFFVKDFQFPFQSHQFYVCRFKQFWWTVIEELLCQLDLFLLCVNFVPSDITTNTRRSSSLPS